MDAPRIVIALADDIASELATNARDHTMSMADAAREMAGGVRSDGMNLRDVANHFFKTQQRLGRLLSLLEAPEYAKIRAIPLVENDMGQEHDPGKPRLTVQAQLEEEIRRQSTLPVPTIVGFFVLELDDLDETAAKTLLRRLRALIEPDPATGGPPDLATAYIEQGVSLASGTATTARAGAKRHPADFDKQVYLTSRGINLPVSETSAEASPSMAYDGSDIQFIDIEEGWNVDHEAFDQEVRDQGPHNNPDAVAMAHGNAALGIVLARGTDSKIRGIAPGCTVKGLYALSEERGSRKRRTETAIRLATKELDAGDVLLLEVQSSSRLPVEVDPGVFRAIQQAVAKGIIVIEPAGNNGSVLEDYRKLADLAPAWADSKTERCYHGFPDSGAIIVGGCEVIEYRGEYDEPREDTGTRGGERIDCCAWSHQVWTSYSETADGYGYFGGTSAASAIIAGVVAVVQQYAKKRLTPERMRELLRHPDCGSPVKSARPGQEARMPDVCKLMKQIDRDAS